MNIHNEKVDLSIKLNIIGTANVAIVCEKLKIKLIYISTNFVYPGVKGNHKEIDYIKPFNNYGWSKLGGECSVQMCKNSLILRMCMTEEPFIHNKTFSDVKTNFEYHKNIAPIIFKLLNKKGIINIGGKTRSIFEFAKSKGILTQKIYAKKLFGKDYPLRQDMNLNKLKKILN